MTMQAVPTTSRPRIGEVQVLSTLARASPATPIGTVPIAIPKASLSERSEKSRLPMADNEPNRRSLTSRQKSRPGLPIQQRQLGQLMLRVLAGPLIDVRIETAAPGFTLQGHQHVGPLVEKDGG